MNPITHPRFRKISGRIGYLGLCRQDLAKAIGRTPSYISDRMSGNKEWTLKECYEILQVLNVSPSEFQDYFPPV